MCGQPIRLWIDQRAVLFTRGSAILMACTRTLVAEARMQQKAFLSSSAVIFQNQKRCDGFELLLEQ